MASNFFSSAEGPIMGARYLSAVGLASLFYDHLLHLDDELTDVWYNFKEKTWLKILFICGRYSTEGYVLYTAAALGGFNFQLHLKDCQAYAATSAALFSISVIGTEAVVIYRIHSLWDHNLHVTYAFAGMFLLVITTKFVGTALEFVHLPQYALVIPGLPECLLFAPDSKPLSYMLLEAVVFVVWEIFNIIMFTSNAFSKPYQCSTEVLTRFKRDGGRYFLCLLAIRSLYLFMVAFGKDSRFSILPLNAALIVVINGRIFHRIGRDFEENRGAPYHPRLHQLHSEELAH